MEKRPEFPILSAMIACEALTKPVEFRHAAGVWTMN
jgi:hypothetical protein